LVEGFKYQYIFLTIFLMISETSIAQIAQKDSSKLLNLARVNFSVNCNFKNIRPSSFATFATDFPQGSGFSVKLNEEYETLAFSEQASYSGFDVNFVFESALFRDSTIRKRRFFTLSMEAGTWIDKLYRIRSESNQYYAYNYTSPVFKIAIGYRHVLTKRDKKIKSQSSSRTSVGINAKNSINLSP